MEPRRDTPDSSRRRLLLAASALCLSGWYPLPASAGQLDPRLLAIRLEARIEAYIKSLRRVGAIPADERTAWSVYDLTLDHKLVSINEAQPFQSASMIKPFIALAFFYRHRDDPGRFPYDEIHRERLEAMIRHSNNKATNYFIDLLSQRSGQALEVEQLLKSRNPEVFRETRIVERIPYNGRTYRNLASARDYSRFLYTLWHDGFPHSRDLKALMQLPNRDRFRSEVLADVEVYDKTGSTARLCGDMGILVGRDGAGQRYPYIFVAMIEKDHRSLEYGSWAKHRGSVIRQVSAMVYQELKTVHRLA